MVKKTNYQNGKVYVIVSSIDRNIKYVGSTCDSLSKRLYNHRACSKQDRCKNSKIYKYFLENGWEKAEISLLETYPCNSKQALLMKEREWKDRLNPVLNIRNPYMSEQEQKEYENNYNKKPQVIEKRKKHYNENRAQIMEKHKQYYNDNKPKIAEQKKKQYNENKHMILGRNHKYRLANKNEIKKKKQKYYNENKQKILEAESEIFKCICGREYTKNHRKRHERSKIHQKYINQQK